MSSKRIIDYLPEFYKPILPRFFYRLIPSEDLATCETCAMCRIKGQPRLPGVNYYRPDAKCCTFYPSLPNYAVGALLLDRRASFHEGRRRIRRLIEREIGAIPHGLISLPEYDKKYKKMSVRYFGKLRSMLCPYYDKNRDNCTIWPFRNSACVTYFCMPVRGFYGITFWKSVYLYLSRLEEVLSAYALHTMGWPTGLILRHSISKGQQTNDPAPLKQESESASLESLWADHKDDKEQIYIEAYKIVSRLIPTDVKRIGGVLSLISLEQVRQAYKKMRSTEIPDRLKKNNTLQIIKRGDNVYLLLPSQAVYTLREPIWSALKHFDGKRSYNEVVNLVKKKHGLTLTRSFILALLRGAILVAVF